MPEGEQQAACQHMNFAASVDVNRIESTAGGPMRFSADIKINCVDCGLPFRFIGLPAGLDLNGAATSVDATEARLAIAPRGEVWTALDGAPSGFSVRSEGPPDDVAILRERVAELVSQNETLRAEIEDLRDAMQDVC